MGEIKILGATVTFIGAIFDSLASRNDGTVRKLMAPSPFQMMFYTCLWVSILAFFTGNTSFIIHQKGSYQGKTKS